MIRLVKSVFLIILSVFILLEVFCRFIIKQPYYAFPKGYFINNQFFGYDLAKNFKGSYSQPEFTISIDTNSDGLRDVGHSGEDNYFKILALGDSFTFGVGVELKNTYLSLLEKLLNEGTITQRYSIIKAGIIGYSTYNERVYLEKKGLNYNPNMVMVQFWWDDLGINHITYLADMGFLTTGKVKDFAQLRLFLNRYLRSYAFLRRIFSKNFNRALFTNKIGVDSEDADTLKNKFEITLKEFKEIESICKDKHIINLFILVPSKEFLSNGSLEREWNSFCLFLKDNDVKYIDLLPALKDAVIRGDKPFFDIDPHLNKTGHKLIAQEIYKRLSF